MAVVMGETYPDLYAAVGVHSGLPYGAAKDMPSAFQAMQGGGPSRSTASRAVPTIVFHGDRDSTVNQRNGQQVLRRWVTPDATGESATTKPLVTVRKGQIPNGHAYTRSVYHAADGRPVAEGMDGTRGGPRLGRGRPAGHVHRLPRPRRLGGVGALLSGASPAVDGFFSPRKPQWSPPYGGHAGQDR